MRLITRLGPRKTILLMAILAALLAMACGLQDLGIVETSATPAASPVPGAPTPTGPRPSGRACPADTLCLPFFGDPPTLDPAVTSDATSAEYIVEIFSGLVTINKDLKIVPDLADKWDVSADGKTYTFRLRKDAKFHNGKAVTAKDFKYAMERAADPKTASPVADSYLGDIVGVKDKLQRKAQDIAGVKVIDDLTLAITIDAPKSYFLAKLTYPTAFVVDQENVERGGKTWFQKPNGTGPYKLAKYEFSQEILLERNDLYIGDPKPSVKRVSYKVGGSAMTRYENNELDVTPVGIIDIDRVLDPTNPLNKELIISPQFNISYYGFNVNKPPFDDVKVRQAFNMAIDKKTLAEVVMRRMRQPAQGILPPGFHCYNPNVQGLDYNPQKAKQLIAESKYKDVKGLGEVTLSISGAGGTAGPVTTAVVEMIRQNIGIEVAIQQAEFATFLADLHRKPSPLQFFEIGWVADYFDAQDFLDILFHSNSLDNNTGYSNPEVDKLVEQAALESDDKKRCELYQKAEQIIVNDAPWIPLFFATDYWVVKPYVKGYLVPPFVIPILKYVTLSQ